MILKPFNLLFSAYNVLFHIYRILAEPVAKLQKKQDYDNF